MSVHDNNIMSESKAEQILKNAEQFYIKKDYESALSVILESKDKLDPGLFHYNLGSLYLKKGELGPARFHLERAKDSGFSYPMLWKNLKYIQEQPQVLDPVKSKDMQEFFVGKTMDVPLSFVGIFSLLIAVIVLFSFRKKWIERKLVVVLFLVIAIAPVGISYSIKKGFNYAIALKPLRVYEGPSKIYPDYGEISAGSRVIINNFQDDWYFILSPRSQSGWVEKTNLGFY